MYNVGLKFTNNTVPEGRSKHFFDEKEKKKKKGCITFEKLIHCYVNFDQNSNYDFCSDISQSVVGSIETRLSMYVSVRRFLVIKLK